MTILKGGHGLPSLRCPDAVNCEKVFTFSLITLMPLSSDELSSKTRVFINSGLNFYFCLKN